ncbi:histidine phosphatase family protein, partial [Bacillus cereus]|nr:histidine phosphatase family protein [Bacillus cereus]
MNATERDLRLFIVRHGESLANIKGILESRNDSPLSDDGQKQATMLAEKLKDYNWLKVFSSPRLRATTTAEKVAGSVKVETIDELLEMDIPLWEGLTW